jgi:hypothetical protein
MIINNDGRPVFGTNLSEPKSELQDQNRSVFYITTLLPFCKPIDPVNLWR